MTVRPGISPIGWTNDAIADLGADMLLETCLGDNAAAGFAGVELGRKFPDAPWDVVLLQFSTKFEVYYSKGTIIQRGQQTA